MIKLAAVGNTAEGHSWDGKGQKDVYQLFISYDNARPVGLQVQYIDEETSSLVLSDVYGKMSGSNFRAIRFDYPSEYITWLKVEGSSRPAGLGPIAMKTNLGNCYGPFPNQFHREISDEMLETGYYLGDENQFGGFHGTADGVHGLRSLGVYVQPVSSLDTTMAETSSHVPVPGSEALKID